MIHTLAWAQLTREKRRLMMALAGIAFAAVLQLMQFGFRDALFISATVVHEHLRADLVLASPLYEYEVSTGSIPRRRLYQAAGVPGVTSVAPLYIGLVPFKNPVNHLDRRILALGVDPNHLALDLPGLASAAPVLEVPDTVLFDELSRPEFGDVAGLLDGHRELVTEVAGQRVYIRGLVRLGVSFGAAGNLITSETTFRRWFDRPEGAVELGLVTVDPAADVDAVRTRLRSVLPKDVQVLTKAEFVAIEHAFWDANTPIGFIFNLGALLGLMVGSVIVYQVLYTDVVSHLHEYATLKAMGYRDGMLHQVVLDEAVMLSLGGFPIGWLLSVWLYALVRQATHLPIEMTVTRTLLVLGLTLGMCLLAGVVAMRKLRAADPAEVF